MDNARFVMRVLEHGRNEERRVRGLKVVSVHALAPGVVVIADSDNDLKALFDVERWEFDHPKPTREKRACLCWGAWDIENSIKTFLGRGGSPPARSLEQMTAYAKSHLHPKEWVRLGWYDVPIDVLTGR